MGRLHIDTRGTLKDLDNSFLALHLEHLTTTLCAIGEGELYNLVVGGELPSRISAERGTGTLQGPDTP